MRKWSTLLSLLALLGACASPPSDGLRVVAVDETGAVVTGKDARFDFGLVARGSEKTLPLVVQNAGNAELTLTGFTFLSGDPVAAKPGVDAPGPIFSVDLGGRLVLQPGTQRELTLRFAPPSNATAGAGFESVVVLHATAGAVADEARLTWTGVAVQDDPCALPDTLDFGRVARGGEGQQHVTLANPGPRPRAVTIGEPVSLTGEDSFFVAPDSPLGEVTLAPGEARDVTLRFLPAESRAYAGRVSVTQAGCAERTVKLAGEGVDQVLDCTATVDFGFALPGASVQRAFTCRNSSFAPVVLTSLGTFEGSAPSASFSLSGGTTLTIPPAARSALGTLTPGEASVGLRFSPTVPGPRTGTLSATVLTVPASPSLVVPLRGVGGGPDVAVSPSPAVDFGDVAYFALATPPSSAAMRVEVRNVGVLPSAPDVRANLKLGVPDGAGGFRRPYWQVTAADGAQASELCLGDFDAATGACLDDLSPSEYDPAVGLEARASAGLAIPVHVVPASLGPKTWTVALFTSDPDEPVVTLTVTANAVQLPPCNARVSAPALHFGLVEPGAERQLALRIENLGTQPGEVCVVSSLALEPESGRPASAPPVFSLVNPPQGSVRLQPGEALEVPVRAAPLTDQWPTAPTPVTGALRFAVSNPGLGNAVSLFADVGRGCLVVHSEDVDFGAQAPSCRSGLRDVTLYNRCTSSVTLTQAGLQVAAGFAAASGPACPGPTACPEFALANLPALPVVLPPGASPLTLQVDYRPLDTGEDLGVLLLQAQENSQPREYAVALHGRGEAQGVNVESFPLPRKADVLLVVDATSSMASKRQSVGFNFPSFIQFAQQQRVDFRVGVTPADPYAGRVLSTSAGERLVTPATVNADQVFSQLVNRGSSLTSVSTCLMPAAAALSWPLSVQPNGNLGLFRRDASLAVVCVTDTAEPAVAPWWTYAEALRRGRSANRLSYTVIGPLLPSPPMGCAYRSTDTGVHAALVDALSGATEDVCTPDWSQVMQRVGRVAFGARETFFLAARPDPMGAAPEVKVDGVVAPASAWTYDAVSNAVRFDSTAPVLPGQTVEVRYPVACQP